MLGQVESSLRQHKINIEKLLSCTFESPLNASKTDSVVKVAANGTTPPVINLAKHATSGQQPSNSAADYKIKRECQNNFKIYTQVFHFALPLFQVAKTL